MRRSWAVMAWAGAGLLVVGGLARPVRAEDPSALERIASVKRSANGSSARLLDTPVLQILRSEQERSATGEREVLRIASSPLFSLYDREASTGAVAGVGRSEGQGRLGSLLGVSLLEWHSAKEHTLDGHERDGESEWRFLKVPVLGSLFARKRTPEGSSYEVLFFLHFDRR